jgi:hypothetical protein
MVPTKAQYQVLCVSGKRNDLRATQCRRGWLRQWPVVRSIWDPDLRAELVVSRLTAESIKSLGPDRAIQISSLLDVFTSAKLEAENHTAEGTSATAVGWHSKTENATPWSPAADAPNSRPITISYCRKHSGRSSQEGRGPFRRAPPTCARDAPR